MQTSLMKVLAARALLRTARGSMLAAGKPEDVARGESYRWRRPSLSESGMVDGRTARPIARGGKLEVTRHGR